MTAQQLKELMMYVTEKGQRKDAQTKDVLEEIKEWIRRERLM